MTEPQRIGDITPEERNLLKKAVLSLREAEATEASAKAKLEEASGDLEDARTRLNYLLLHIRTEHHFTRLVTINYETGEAFLPG